MGLGRFSFSSTEAGCFSLCRGGGQREAAARYGSSGGWFPCEVSCKRRGRGSRLCPEVTSASLRPRVVVVAAAARAEPEGDRAFVTGDVDEGAMTDSNPARFVPQEQRLWPAAGAPTACPGWAWHHGRWGFCPRVGLLGGITSLVKRKNEMLGVAAAAVTPPVTPRAACGTFPVRARSWLWAPTSCSSLSRQSSVMPCWWAQHHLEIFTPANPVRPPLSALPAIAAVLVSTYLSIVKSELASRKKETA